MANMSSALDTPNSVLCPVCDIWYPLVRVGTPCGQCRATLGNSAGPVQPTLTDAVMAEVACRCDRINPVGHGEVVVKIQDGKVVLLEVNEKFKPLLPPATPDSRRRLEHK